MFRKKYYLIIAALAISFLLSVSAFAQISGLSGRVMLKQAEGKSVPFEGALVEVFRIDQKGVTLQDTTNKRGEFSFVSVTLGGTYILSVSGTGIGPALSNNLKPGESNLAIEVSEGDGRRLTEEEVKQVLDASMNKGGEMTADQKKSEAERLKLEAEIKSKNEKVVKADQAANSALAAGITAFEAGNKDTAAKNYDGAIGNFDVAISKFEEGFNANPDYIGSAPIMLNNKALSLVKRATASYNKMVTSKDPVLKRELTPKFTKDFEDAIETYFKSWNVSKSGDPAEIARMQKGYDDRKLQTLVGANETVSLMIKTEATSESKKDAVAELMRQYVAAEKDQKKKEAAQLDLGSYMNKIFDFEAAIVEFRKLLGMAPNNTEGIGLLGLALYTVTYDSDDTARKQEALNYMQHFLDTASKDDKLRDGIEGGVADLKSKKLKPQKITAKN